MVSGELPVADVETGSAYAFLRLGLAFAADSERLTAYHFNALTASLKARENMASTVYYSLAQKSMLYLEMLHGLSLYAALYAFALALTSSRFGDSARKELKAWVEGDARAVVYAMIVLKWGAELKTPAPGDSDGPSGSRAAEPIPELMALSRIAEALRDTDGEVDDSNFEMLRKVAEVDGEKLNSILPPLVDALACSAREQVLEVLTLATRSGFDISRMMPLLGGVLLDRDYYDEGTVGRLFDCLRAAIESGVDARVVWPFVALAMPVGDKQLRLIKAGVERGYPARPFLSQLKVDFCLPVPPGDETDPMRFSSGVSRVALALSILSIGIGRGELKPEDIDGGDGCR